MARAAAIIGSIAIAACSHAGSRAPGGPSVARVGLPAPDWTQPLAGGGTLALASLHGKPVYLNFFASWCEPCNEEAPAINSLQKRYAARGLHTVGVDEAENASTALAFKKRYSLVYPAIVDSGALQDQYNVNGLPVHVFIDRTGVVRRIVIGQMAAGEIEHAILQIL